MEENTTIETTVESTNGGAEETVNIDNNVSANEKQIKTFTQDELNSIIEKRLAKERAKFEKEIGQEKYKEGMSEAEKLNKMNEQEKQEYEFSKRLSELEAKEKEYTLKELKTESRSIFNELGYGKSDIEALESFVNFDSAETTKQSIEALDKVIKSLVESRVQSEVDKKIVTKTKPVGSPSTGGFTWNDVMSGNCTYEAWKKNGSKR